MINSFVWIFLVLIVAGPPLIMGNALEEVGIVFLIGLILTSISEGLRRKTTWQHKFNVITGILLGLVYFAIGFPSLKKPDGEIPMKYLALLIAFSALPILLVVLIKKNSSKKTISSILNR